MSEPLLTDWKSLPRPVAIAGSVIVPRCPTCGRFEPVAPVHGSGIDPGVDYWSCTTMWPDLGNALDEHGAGGVPSQMPRLSARRTLPRRRSCLGPLFHLCCVRRTLDAAGSLRADCIAQGTIDDRVPVDRTVRRAAHCDGHRLELFHPADASTFPREWSPLRRLCPIAACSRQMLLCP
jgi:hypothetical protein